MLSVRQLVGIVGLVVGLVVVNDAQGQLIGRREVNNFNAPVTYGGPASYGGGCYGSGGGYAAPASYGYGGGYVPPARVFETYVRDERTGRLHRIVIEEAGYRPRPFEAENGGYSMPYVGGNGGYPASGYAVGNGSSVYQNGGRARVTERQYCPTCP